MYSSEHQCLSHCLKHFGASQTTSLYLSKLFVKSNSKYNHGNNSTLQVDIFCSWVTVPEAQNIKEGTNLSQGVRGFSPSLANSNMEA